MPLFGKSKEEQLLDAAFTGNEEQVSALLRKGANVNAIGIDGGTPLHNASKYGHDKVVGMLIALGGNVDAVDDDGCTPLHRASNWGHDRVVRLLINAGADIAPVNGDGRTPLDLAKLKNKVMVEKLLTDVLALEQPGRTAPSAAAAFKRLGRKQPPPPPSTARQVAAAGAAAGAAAASTNGGNQRPDAQEASPDAAAPSEDATNTTSSKADDPLTTLPQALTDALESSQGSAGGEVSDSGEGEGGSFAVGVGMIKLTRGDVTIATVARDPNETIKSVMDRMKEEHRNSPFYQLAPADIEAISERRKEIIYEIPDGSDRPLTKTKQEIESMTVGVAPGLAKKS
mmetsp:Transcript_12492/g.26432  ORF Transcript_12492/g.26432 Transcript_12492/m.26432 type:complete len:342 (-) Transcript_12492:15-1040(-)